MVPEQPENFDEDKKEIETTIEGEKEIDDDESTRIATEIVRATKRLQKTKQRRQRKAQKEREAAMLACLTNMDAGSDNESNKVRWNETFKSWAELAEDNTDTTRDANRREKFKAKSQELIAIMIYRKIDQEPVKNAPDIINDQINKILYTAQKPPQRWQHGDDDQDDDEDEQKQMQQQKKPTTITRGKKRHRLRKQGQRRKPLRNAERSNSNWGRR